MNPQLINDPAAISAAINAAILASAAAQGITLETIKDLPSGGTGVTVAHGLHPVSLREPAMLVQPEDTWIGNNCPMVDVMERPGMAQSPDQSWKLITATNSAWPTSGEGLRGPKMTRATVTRTNTMKKVGVDDEITYEAQKFGQRFKVDAMREKTLINIAKRNRERVLIGGNPDAIPSPTGASISTALIAGTLAAGSYVFRVSSLSYKGLLLSQEPLYQGGNDGVTNTLGESIAGTASVAHVLAGPGGIRVTFTDVRRSFGYGVYTEKDGAGGYLWQAATDTNRADIIALSGSTHTPNTVDTTPDPNDPKGIFAQILDEAIASTAGAYYRSLDGAAFTDDSRGGVQQITEALTVLYRRWKASPAFILAGPDAFLQLSTEIASNVPPNLIASMQLQVAGVTGQIIGGVNATRILHPITGQLIPIIVHWMLPSKWVAGFTFANPNPDPDFPNAIETLTCGDWDRFFFAQVQLKTEAGIYQLMCPAVYFAAGMFVLKNAPANPF